MSGFTEKRLTQLREVLSEYVREDVAMEELMKRVMFELGVAEDLEKRRAYQAKVREQNGGSTYTASDRAYYEKHKEELKQRMAERRRKLREASEAAKIKST